MDGLTLYTAPAVEPLTLQQVKLHCRIDDDHTADDPTLDGLIIAAREHVEAVTRRALITQTWELALDRLPACGEICLPNAPLQSVTSFTYYDSTGAATVWSSSNYVVDTRREPGRLVLGYGLTWPQFTARPTNAVVIRYVAGYGASGESVPKALQQAMLLLVSHWYENREAVIASPGLTVIPSLPFAVDALLGPYRVLEL